MPVLGLEGDFIPIRKGIFGLLRESWLLMFGYRDRLAAQFKGSITGLLSIRGPTIWLLIIISEGNVTL